MPVLEERMRTQDFLELENRFGAHNYHPLNVIIKHTEDV